MKRFSFSLQKLLDYKEQLFDVERTVLGDMRAALNQMIEERERLEQEHIVRSREFNEKAGRGITALEMERHKNYMLMVDLNIKNKIAQIELQQQAIDKQMDKVREAKIEISTMEKLKQKKLEEYQYIESKAQEQFIEEFVSYTRFATELAG